MTGSLALPMGWADTPVSRPSGRRPVAAGLVVMLLAVFVAQGAVLTPSRRSASQPAQHSTAAARLGATSGVGADQAVHAFVPVPGRPGTFEVHDPAYVSRLAPSGFSYTPTGASRPFEISLASIERGGHGVPLRLGDWTARADRAERPAAPAVLERVTARGGEVEWDVILANQPAGTGALVVGAHLAGVVGAPTRVQVSGRPAWHLGLRGGSKVQVDEVVVLDATGAEVHRSLPIIEDNRIELRVPDDVLVGATYPLTVDPTLSGPVTIATGPSTGPSVASDGVGNHLVVWQGYDDNGNGPSRILGARVAADGSVGAPFQISAPASGNAAFADVAWNGTNYLVVFTQDFFTGAERVKARIVSPAGTPAPAELSISQAPGSHWYPRVAAAGTSSGSWLVVWHGVAGGASQDILGARVSAGGDIISPEFRIGPDSGRDAYPDVAWNGSRFLVAWAWAIMPNSTSSNKIFTCLVTTDGAACQAAPRSVDDGGLPGLDRPAVASDGNGNSLVVWQWRNPGADNNVYGRLVDSAGVRVGDQILVSTVEGDQRFPAVAFNGSYLVAWRDDRFTNGSYIFAARVSTTGVREDSVDGVWVSYPEAGSSLPAVAPAQGEGRWVVDYEVGSTAIREKGFDSADPK